MGFYSWQLSPDHQMVAIDEFFDPDEFFGVDVEERPFGGARAARPIGRRDLVATNEAAEVLFSVDSLGNGFVVVVALARSS